jgi:murein DD-endopeptidase MepM/ murein hydrolase activator NlpD
MGISPLGIRIMIGAAVLIVLTVLGVGYAAVTKAVALSKLDRLERRNDVLAEELAKSRDIVASISTSIDSITRQDSMVRVLAGLEPVDPGVQQAGIGGPAGAWTEREQILSEGPEGQEALQMMENLDALMRRASMLETSFNTAKDSLDANIKALTHYPSILPAKGWRTSDWSVQRMHPIFHQELPHPGIDVAAPTGTPIFAAANGTVTAVYNNGGYGLMVIVNHGRGLVTRYAHCSKATVKKGQAVTRGEKIAEVGRSGIATAPHLHYEVLEYGKAVDPKKYILPKAIID